MLVFKALNVQTILGLWKENVSESEEKMVMPSIWVTMMSLLKLKLYRQFQVDIVGDHAFSDAMPYAPIR